MNLNKYGMIIICINRPDCTQLLPNINLKIVLPKKNKISVGNMANKNNLITACLYNL